MSVKLGFVGTGTVGTGCLEILSKHKESFKRHYGIDLEVQGVCDLDSVAACKYGLEDVYTNNFQDILNNPDIDIVVELVGGVTIAKQVVIGALSAGKNVVTANKALMASCGEEIMGLAEQKGLDIAFEASVGGGIPIIGPLKQQLISNEISQVMGIVNGTTNYMLTRIGEGLTYDVALDEAQKLGYAEADPTADVEGHDAAAKIAILSSIAFNSRVQINDVFVDGITNLTPLDLQAAENLGFSVKLLAIANRTTTGIDVRVHPAMLPKNHQLASVVGVDNAIFVVGDAVGETMFFGPGAGAGPAASAVMGDVLDMARRITIGTGPILQCTCTDNLPIDPMDQLQCRYYIRFTVYDKPGVMAAMTNVFAKHNVNLHTVMQRGKANTDSMETSIIYITHMAQEKQIQSALKEITELENVTSVQPSVIRVEE